MADQDDRSRPGSPQRPSRDAPHLTPRAAADKAAREDRLAAEMRNNLRKRKQRWRAREGRAPADP